MEQLIVFNGVRVVLTMARGMHEVQNFLDVGEVFISVYRGYTRVIGAAAAERAALGDAGR
jgi:hypothetical protein